MDPHIGPDMPGDEYGAQQDSTRFPELPAPGGPEAGTELVPRMTRPPRDPLTPEVGSGTADGDAPRVVQLVVGDCLLTLNPVDGSEVSTLPAAGPPTPVRRDAEARAARTAATHPAVPPGPRRPELPLLEREEERERLSRLLSRGRSVRVTGPSGAGRSVLLDAVAEASADLAPDGVIRLSGYRRTPSDLLQELFSTVYDTEDEPSQGGGAAYRPDRARLTELLREVGAVVVLDDLEFGGAALEELLAAAPECAFVMAATPDVAAPSSDSAVEEIFLPGLTRVACLELLELAAGRPLQEEETAWAADLWFESEGLPLRFVQAGALLRQRDTLAAEILAADESVWGDTEPADELPVDAPFDAIAPSSSASSSSHVPLPSLAESAAPAALLASRLTGSAQDALRFAVALGGECPHQSHLPALVGETHGDAALGELVAVGLVAPVDRHHRLTAGVRTQLAAPGELAEEAAAEGAPQALTAAQHYTWWVGHPSVTPERVAAEAEAVLAALAACRDGGHASAAVLLAHTVAPVFAASLHWSAWERALRMGQEAARQAGEVAEEAYFLHELGVLALCLGSYDRARSELEASIALRGALADRQGTTVGRRTLALVLDRAGIAAPFATPEGAETAAAGLELPDSPTMVISKRLATAGPRRLGLTGSRRNRNLVAAGAGALLAAVLGTIVTLGTTASGGDQNSPMNVKPVESAQPDGADDGLPADGTSPTPGSTHRPSSPSASGSGLATDPNAPGAGTVGGDGGSGGVGGSTSGGDGGSGGVGGSASGGGGSHGGGSASGGGGNHGGTGNAGGTNAGGTDTGGTDTGGTDTGGTDTGGTDTGGTDTGGTSGSPSGSPDPTDPTSPTGSPTDPDGGTDSGTSSSASAPEDPITVTGSPAARASGKIA
ncbi:ATP-binding protein [Streptomyces sp. NPDC058691]|uniref:ATP-binding protein n=1 Tax=Streptomyces sp. NPDC058691 TaxID=3346601 RepID=UPI003659A48C